MFKAAIPIFRTGSISAARTFYCDVLGFSVQSTYRPGESDDPAYMVLRRDAAVMHLSSFPGDGVFGNVVTLLVDDIETLHAQLSGRGVDVGEGIMNQDWGDRELYVRDPDGNAIRFQMPG